MSERGWVSEGPGLGWGYSRGLLRQVLVEGGSRRPSLTWGEGPGTAAGNFVVLRACGSCFRSLPPSRFFSLRGRSRIFPRAVAESVSRPAGAVARAGKRRETPGSAGKRGSAGLAALPSLRGAEVAAAARGLRLPGV